METTNHFSPLSSVAFGVSGSVDEQRSCLGVHFSWRMGGVGLFCGVFDGVDRGVVAGVLAAELAALVLLGASPWPPFPFRTSPSRSLKSFAPFFAFLNKTEVRLPTPAVDARCGEPSSRMPLATAAPSICKTGGGDAGCSCASVQFLLGAVPSESSSSSFRRLQGQVGDWGSPVMGRKVGGSRGMSPCRGGGAGSVGSSVGGEEDLKSSAREKWRGSDLIEFLFSSGGKHFPFSMWVDVVVQFYTGKWCHCGMISL